jgi:hypothetical protein
MWHLGRMSEFLKNKMPNKNARQHKKILKITLFLIDGKLKIKKANDKK